MFSMHSQTWSPLALLALGAVLASCAAAPGARQDAAAPQTLAQSPAQERACFRLSSIRGQKVISRDTVLFRTGLGQGEIFRMDMANACLDTMNSDPLVLTPSGGTDQICGRLDLSVRVATPIGATPCMIQDVRRLTPAEVAALAPDQRP